MSGYYIIKENIQDKHPSIDVYNDCLRFDHQHKEAYCPLCNRFIEGSVWEGPYTFYVRSLQLTDVLFPLAPVYILFSEKFVNMFYQEGLTGIKSMKACEILFRGEKIPQKYFIPVLEYSNKALDYALTKNNERTSNKLLPRCSLCMKPNREKDNLYFGDPTEFDIFKVYDRHGDLFCSESFVQLCHKLGIRAIEFRKIK